MPRSESGHRLPARPQRKVFQNIERYGGDTSNACPACCFGTEWHALSACQKLFWLDPIGNMDRWSIMFNLAKGGCTWEPLVWPKPNAAGIFLFSWPSRSMLLDSEPTVRLGLFQKCSQEICNLKGTKTGELHSPFISGLISRNVTF